MTDNGIDQDRAADVVTAGVEAEGQPQQVQYPGVFVMRVPVPDDQGGPGKERIEFMEVNGIDPLAVPSLLRIAAYLKEQQLGIAERR